MSDLLNYESATISGEIANDVLGGSIDLTSNTKNKGSEKVNLKKVPAKKGLVRKQAPLNKETTDKESSNNDGDEVAEEKNDEEKFGLIDVNKLNFEFDRYFLSWLKQNKAGLVVCSYKSNAIFSMGCTQNLKTGNDMISLWITNSMRPMGATYDEERKKLWVGSCLQLWQYYNQGKKKTDREMLPDFDAYFIPRRMHTINDIDVHDVSVDGNGDPYFVSALFCCICVPSDSASFKVYWRPPWVSKTAAEDRCHLNGLCMRNGKPRYVTSVARTDIRGGWRDHRNNGGVVWDIVENKLICKNLSMPHSPRFHNGKLWLLESGTGYFGYVDFSKTVEDTEGKKKEKYHPFVKKVFLPSYIRGITFVNDKYAVIGGSQDRHEQTFQGLKLSDNLEEKGMSSSKCALYVVDLESFDIIHQFEFTGSEIKEIYDVTFIPNVRRPIISELDFQGLATEFKMEEDEQNNEQ